MKDKGGGGSLYAIIVIIIILELLGMFAFFSNSVDAEPLLKDNKIKVDNSSVETVVANKPPKVNKPIFVEPDTLNRLLGEYSTTFDLSQENRAANIKLAALFIDKYKLSPGDSFSFNDVVGARTVERGFKTAPIIVNKKPVPGVGGGICQVSTTLFNAVLEAGLSILERHPHSVPVSYVPSGRDATVADDYLDFRFENNLKEYIIIKTEVNGPTVRAQIYSLK